MREAAADGDLLRCVEADIRFHEFMLSCSGQPHTTQVWRSIAPRIRAYFFRFGRHSDLGTGLGQQHSIRRVADLRALDVRERDRRHAAPGGTPTRGGIRGSGDLRLARQQVIQAAP